MHAFTEQDGVHAYLSLSPIPLDWVISKPQLKLVFTDFSYYFKYIYLLYFIDAYSGFDKTRVDSQNNSTKLKKMQIFRIIIY